MPTYVVEHMEPDESSSTFPPWVSLEYSQMLLLASAGPGPSSPSSESKVIFSSLSSSSADTLPRLLQARGAPPGTFRAERDKVLTLMHDEGVTLDRVCLLDPKAEKVIAPEDHLEFDWFLFGGILGDDPPRDRTGELRRLGFPTRHLGPVQMTTDTALGVTKLVVQDGVPLDQIPFVDHPTLRFSAHESVEMPFRYVVAQEDGPAGSEVKKGEPILPRGMRQLLRDDMDKGFDALDDD